MNEKFIEILNIAIIFWNKYFIFFKTRMTELKNEFNLTDPKSQYFCQSFENFTANVLVETIFHHY